MDVGSARSSQLAKDNSGALGNRIYRIRASDMFGGVPINVAIPPMEAEYAVPSMRAMEKRRAADLSRCSRIGTRIAIAMGTIIMVDAVLLIHIDKNHVDVINPSTMRGGLVPRMRKMRSAMRRCNSQRCIASANKNPPMNRKIR